FFFLQAEDGIRDKLVTGVQTCALPISGQPYQGYAESVGAAGLPALPQLSDVSDLLDGDTRMRVWYSSASAWRVDVIDVGAERDRSEERRVGKEWMPVGRPCHCKRRLHI